MRNIIVHNIICSSVPVDILAILPYLLQLILPLVNAVNTPPPPATSPPLPTPTPVQQITTRPTTSRPYQLQFPNYGFGSYGFGFPFDYNNFYNPYPYYSFYGNYFPPFRGATLQRNRTRLNQHRKNENKVHIIKHDGYRKKHPIFYHFIRKGRTMDLLRPTKEKRKLKKKAVKSSINITKHMKKPRKKNRRKVKTRKLKKNKENHHIAFFKKIKVPGKSTTLTVSSQNLQGQIDFEYLGKSYHMTLHDIMKHVGKHH